MKIGVRSALFWLASTLCVASACAQEKEFPSKPIRLVAPFGPGSGADTSGRFFAELLGKTLGQSAFVENRPGASGSVGAVAVKNAPADGYTVLIAGWSAQAVNPIVFNDLPYDPIKDFKPVSGLTRSALGFFVPGNTKIHTLADLVTAAKNSKQLLNGGTISEGQQIIVAWFSGLAGVKFQNVPYKTGTQMLTDLMGNQIDWATESIPPATPLIRSGKLRMLATSGETRHSEHPNVPTVRESGYPEFTNYGWSGLYVRTETPPEIAGVLAEAMQKVMATPAARDFARKLGSELMPFGPEAMRKYEADQLATFRRVAQASGITAGKMGN
jgi:tripartite-type tricarboxylate transporter receptor subunit TctC